MRKLLLILLIITFLTPKNTYAQDDGAAVAVAAVAGIAAIGAAFASIEQMKEQIELTATEWILTNHPELTSFSLTTLDFKGKKLKDMSAVSVITFKIQEFTPASKPILDGKKQVLFGFTSHGWITERGVNFSKVRWYLLDSSEWMNMMVAYVQVASDQNDVTYIKEVLQNGNVGNSGVKVKSKTVLPFYKLGGDMYVVTDYSPSMKLIYNERSLGIYLKETMDLVQIRRRTIIEIQDFFFKDD